MEVIPNTKLTIKPIDKQVYQDPNSPLCSPEATFTMGVVGSKGSGKSTLILNLLLRKEFYRKQFDKVYLCVATVKSDSKWRKINLDALDGQLMPNDWDEELLETWMRDTQEDVEQAKANDEQPPLTLVVVDDYASYLNSSPTLRHWLLNSRHLKTSFIISTQKLSLIPTTIRTNIDCWVLYPPHSSNEKNMMIEEIFSPYLSRKQIEELLKLVWKDSQDFVYVNTRLPKNKMFHTKFSTILIKDD